jgi:hypothetical protein
MKTVLAIFTLSLGIAGAAPLPLGGAANVPLVDTIAGDDAGGWTDQGAENSLSGFPAGDVTFEGVPFVIPPEGSNAAVAFQSAHRSNMPAKISISAGGAKGAFLYLLTSCAFEFTRGQEVAAVTVRYADGTTQEEPLVYERQTGAWWTPSTPDEGVVAWHGKNAMDVPVGVYLSWIKLNGTPVESVDVRSANGKGMFLLLGLSISDVTGIKIPPRWLPEPLDTKSWFPSEPLADNGRPSAWDDSPQENGRRLVADLDLPLREFSADDSAKLARTLRLLGYNTARLPSLETFLPPVGTAVTSGADPKALASLRALVAALEKEKIAVALTLGGGRQYGIDDGVAAYRHINPMLSNQYFVDRDASRLLLDTVRSASDAHPVWVSLLANPVLQGDYESLFTPPHRNMLQNAWRAWLLKKHASKEEVIEDWQVPGNPPPANPGEALARPGIELLNVHNFSAFQSRFRRRFADQMAFLEELQAGWFASIVPEVRKVFPSATIFSPGWMVSDRLGDAQTRASTFLDGIEERVGDNYAGKGTEGSTYFFNRSPFLAPDRWSYRPSFNRVGGKPFLAIDNALAWPGDYEFSRLLLTMVFGGLQGWDGILHHGISTPSPAAPMVPPDKAGSSLQNPAFLAILPLGRHLFLRGDLDRAPTAFSRALESPATFREHGPAPFPPAFQNLLFVGGVEAIAEGAPPDNSKATTMAASATVLKSATGQVECDAAKDLLKISTPASLALAGKDGGSLATGSASLESSAAYGVVYATALDRSPLSSSRSLLLGAVGRTRNSGQAVDVSNGPLGLHERLWRVREPGSSPILMEPARGVLTLRGVPGGNWTLQPINLLGQPTDAKPATLSPKDGALRVEFDNKTSPLLLLRHEAR